MRARIATLAIVACTVAAIAQPRDPTFLAIVRNDGLLVPIAIHDGREWWNRWPWAAEGGEVKALPVPRSIESIPAAWLPPDLRLPREWRFQGRSGPTRRLTISRPTRPVAWDLMDTIGLQTDYRPGPRVRKAEQLNESDVIGIAISGSGELGRVRPATADESNRIRSQLRARFAVLEKGALETWTKEYQQSTGVPPLGKLTRVYRKGAVPGEEPLDFTRAVNAVGDRIHYYVASEKLFNMGLRNQPDCKVNLSLNGAVITGATGTVVSEKLNAFAFAEYCGDAAEWLTPLAAVSLHGRPVWIVLIGVEDGYDYALWDPERGESLPTKGNWGTVR